jgi:hypothetical protein
MSRVIAIFPPGDKAMQNSRKNNVVELNQLGHARGGAGQDGPALLNECGEMAAVKLASGLARTLEGAAGELLEISDRISAYEMRRICEDAMIFAREQPGVVETEFRRRFYQHFKRECRRDNGQQSGSTSLEASQLSLVDPDELEGSLAASTIENALNNSCGEELFGLSKRIGVLLSDPELQSGANPLGPEVIGAAVMDTLKGQGLPLKTQLVLVPLINKYLPRHVRAVYLDINRHLVDRGILPTIRVGGRKPVQPSPSMSETSKRGESPEPAEESQDLLAMLRQLMTLGSQGGGNPGVPGGVPGFLPAQGAVPATMSGLLAGGLSRQAVGTVGAGSSPSSVTPVVMQALTNLQRGQSESLAAAGLDGALLANGQVNILREIRSSPVVGSLGQMDSMTLDIVAMVFDYILDDRRIPDAMKALIGRLQIPVLKVAMLDRAFFSQKTHPARRLLDALAEASMGWNEDEGHESGLYRKVDELVQRVLNQFDEELDIFAMALEDFIQYESDEKRRIDETTGKSAQLIRQREQGEIARIVAHNEVESHLFDHDVPDFIRAFLLGHWEQLLGFYCAHDGEGGEDWTQALRTMDDLVWSVAPKQTAEERKKLVALLPDLLKRLDRGLTALGTPGQVRDLFFTGLVKCHAVAVRAGLRGASIASPELELTPIPMAESGTEPELTSSTDFVEIPVLTEVVDVDPALLEEISAEPEERPLLEEIVIGDVGWLARSGEAIEKDEHEVRVLQLKRGTWIEYRQEDGTPARAKLAWVSPLKGIYLFTNRLGQRAMSINAAGLSAKFRAGEAQILDSVPLMERAVNSLLERLQKQVA